MNVALIAAGGALGSVARYGLSMLTERLMPSSFLYGTFVVNVLGCLCFGMILGAAAGQRFTLSPGARAFLLIGILSGFTTFSAFTYETFVLLQHGAVAQVLANVVGQVTLGVIALWGGYALLAAL